MRGAGLAMMLALTATARAHAQGLAALDAPADTALVQYAGQVIIENLANAMSSAAHDTTQGWWTMNFPTSHAPDLWHNLRDYLTTALHARDSLATDSSRSFIYVGDVRMVDNVMTFRVTLGIAQRCGGGWHGNDQSYFVRTEHSGGTWMWPTVTQGSHSYSAPCW